jgi:predicted O-methyltransferase YrrM
MKLPTYLENAVQAIFAESNLINIQQHEWEMRTFLALALSELKPDRTVELGTFRGFAGALLSQVTGNITISVDIEDHGTIGSKPYGHELNLLIADAAIEPTVKQVMESLGGPIDMLFIDDGHYYETIVKEMELWRPHVRPGGWIVFHDINPLANIGPHGVQPESMQTTRYWNELEGDKFEIVATQEHAAFKGTLPHGGLGILRV